MKAHSLMFRHGMLAAWAVVALASSQVASAGLIVIDSFNFPNPGNLYVVSTNQTNPSVFVEQEAGILGGEREFQIQVNGMPQPLSALGVVQDGTYIFGSSSPGSTVTFEYDGVDQPGSGVAPSSALSNAHGLTADLSGSPLLSHVQIDFVALDSGASATKMDVKIRLTSAGGGTADYDGFADDSASPFSYIAPYNLFTTSPSFDFSNVDSIRVQFNSLYKNDVDFEINQISTITNIPEPSTFVLAALGLVAVFPAIRRRLRRG